MKEEKEAIVTHCMNGSVTMGTQIDVFDSKELADYAYEKVLKFEEEHKNDVNEFGLTVFYTRDKVSFFSSKEEIDETFKG